MILTEMTFEIDGNLERIAIDDLLKTDLRDQLLARIGQAEQGVCL